MRWSLLQKRESCRLFVVVLTILSLSLLWISCSGSPAKSAMATPTPTPQPSPGPNPSPTPVASPSPSPSPGSTASTYLYVGTTSNLGGVQGFRVDSQKGALAEVPGSPLLFGTGMTSFPEAGPVAAAQGHVFVGFGPPNFAAPVIRSYTVDPATGSLGTFVETNGGAVNGDDQIRALVTDPAGHNLYAVYQNNLASFQIHSDGSLTLLGTLSNLATAFTFSLTIDPAANLAYLGVDNCPPKGTCGGPPDILLLARDPNTGMLSNTGKMLGVTNVADPGALAVDPTGGHLIATTVSTSGTEQISVFNIDSTGALSPVAGSPFSAGNIPPASYAFDTTGHFLYVVNSTGISPQPESVTVYSFDQQNGAIQQLQNESLPPGNFLASMLVSNSFVFVVDSQAGTMPSVIYVLQRDGNTGMVSAPVFTQVDKPGGQQAGLGQSVELSF